MALKIILPNSIYQQSAIENAPFKPYVWWRFIGDIFMVWTEGKDNLQTFLHHLNSIHPTITFAHEYSNSSHQSLPFLYVQDHLVNSLIETDLCENFLDLMKLHTKPTDKRHPALQILCFFLLNTAATFLKKNRARFIPRQETLKPQPQNNNSNKTPFVITYIPALSNFSTTVRKNVNILQTSNRCKQIFPSPPIVAYKRSPNLPDLLVRRTWLYVAYIKKNHLPEAFQNAIIHAALPVHF